MMCMWTKDPFYVVQVCPTLTWNPNNRPSMEGVAHQRTMRSDKVPSSKLPKSLTRMSRNDNDPSSQIATHLDGGQGGQAAGSPEAFELRHC